MRWPRVRFTVRRMMVAVAVFALVSLGVREFRAWWLRPPYRPPLYRSQLTATLATTSDLMLSPGVPIPVSIAYDLKFNNPMPDPGTTYVLRASVWFEDMVTGRYVDGYTFDAPLTIGGREATSGALTWDAQLPCPGRYILHRRLEYETRWGRSRLINGGAHPCKVVAAAPAVPRPSDPGARP